MDKAHKLVTLYQTYDAFEANMIKSLLDSEDIYCYLNTNDANGVLPQLNLTQGGNELLVREEDFEDAKNLLEDFIKN